MEPSSDRRFDPNYAAQLLLDMTHEQPLDDLLQKLVARVTERPNVACAQVWLIDQGDLCSSCPRRAECPDTSRCLHLVAGHGKPLADFGPNVPRFDDLKARMPLSEGFLLGKVAITGQQIVLKELDQQPLGFMGFDWLIPERIRCCAATPIVYKGEVLGASIGFTRGDPPDEIRPWGRIFANHIGAAIANARAFKEIQRLKEQLEQHNTYLQEEVVEAKAFGDLVGQSAALCQIVSQIDLVAPTEARVRLGPG